MRIARRGKPDEQASQQQEVTSSESSVRTQSWTYGVSLAARTGYVVLLAAIVIGPLAAGYAAWSARSAQSAVAEAVAASDSAQPGVQEYTAAAEAGTATVEAWLSASREDHEWLASLVNVESLDLPDTPFTYRAPMVVSIEPGAAIWTVTVAVSVQSEAAAEEGPTWQRAYFEVPVGRATPGAGFAAVTLPSPIGAPARTPAPDLPFSDQLAASHEISTAVNSFLLALLTGEGEVERYISPGTQITPVAEGSYAALGQIQVFASRPGEELTVDADGTQAAVLVHASLERMDGEPAPVAYVLDLTTRSGRWEVSGMHAAAALAIHTGGESDARDGE